MSLVGMHCNRGCTGSLVEGHAVIGSGEPLVSILNAVQFVSQAHSMYDLVLRETSAMLASGRSVV